MALIAVIAVLLALSAIAAAFLGQMEHAASRTRATRVKARCDEEVDSLFALANLTLLRGTRAREIEAEQEDPEGPYSTPDCDTRREFSIDPAVLRGPRDSDGTRYIRDLRIEDEQGRLNVNSVPYFVLANLIGATELSRDLEPGESEIRVADASIFPEHGGLVRIGTELYSYRERIAGALLGARAEGPGRAAELPAGTLASRPEAMEIATRPFFASPGRHVPYRCVAAIRTISDLGTLALLPDDYGRIAGALTCFSWRPVANDWCDEQRLVNRLPGDELVIANPRYYGPGTMVRLTDGEKTAFALVAENDGSRIRLATPVDEEFEADSTRVSALCRHPVNLNTASPEVLVACLERLALRGREDEVSSEEAAALARRIAATPLADFYDLNRLLLAAVNDGVISPADRKAIYLDALNARDSRLRFSTVPFCFVSHDTATVTATVVAESRTGEELARSSRRRIVSVEPFRSQVSSLRSQTDFERQVIAGRDARWTITYPFNTGGTYQGRNEPSSRYPAHVLAGIWPSTDRDRGGVRLKPERLNLPHVFHFDDTPWPEGFYAKDAALGLPTDHPDVDLAAKQGMKPFSLSFWYRSYGDGSGPRTVFDTGEMEYTNRVALFVDRAENELVLRVADGTLERRAVELRQKLEPGLFDDDTFYHVTASVAGSRPGDLSLLVDGLARGTVTYQTRLMGDWPRAKSTVKEREWIDVQDATSFPESGVLCLTNVWGMTIVEYDTRTDTAFHVHSSGQRHGLADQSWIWGGGTHHDGEVVELMGYSHPLVTDVHTGAATLTSNLGKARALRVTYDVDVLKIPADPKQGGGVPGRLAKAAGQQDQPPADGEIRGIAAERSSVVLALGSDIVAYRSSITDQEALDAFSPRGFALLRSRTLNFPTLAGTKVGGWEIVYYEKSPLGLKIERYRSTRQIEAARPYFLPTRYRPPRSNAWVTVPAALIPISIEVAGKHADFIDTTRVGNLSGAFAQIDDEWFCYTYPDRSTTGDSTLLVWDNPYALAIAGAGGTPPGRVVPAPPKKQAKEDPESDSYRGRDSPLPARPSDDPAGEPSGVPPPDEGVPPPPTADDGGGGSDGGDGRPPAPPLPPDDGGETPTATDPGGGDVDPTAGEDDGPPDPYLPPRPDHRGRPDPVALTAGQREYQSGSGVASSRAEEHSRGAEVRPAFAVAMHDGRSPGRGDRITLVSSTGARQEATIQRAWLQAHVYNPKTWNGWSFVSGFGRNLAVAWVAPTSTLRAPVRYSRGRWREIDRGPQDPRLFARILKFPSGEMPCVVSDRIQFAGSLGGGVSPAMVDEIYFRPDVDDRIYRVGDGARERLARLGLLETSTENPRYPGIQPGDHEIPIHTHRDTRDDRRLPVADLPDDGGVVRIDEELIAYEHLDAVDGLLSGCRRGVLGTEPESHSFDARVNQVDAVTLAFLRAFLSPYDFSLDVSRIDGFPATGGQVLVDDEVIGYSEIRDGYLVMPRRVSPEAGQWDLLPTKGDSEAGVFRGRFGTEAAEHAYGNLVWFLPARYPDRYTGRAVGFETSGIVLGHEEPGAVFKRISWDEERPELTGLDVTVRFDDGPEWDSDRIYDPDSDWTSERDDPEVRKDPTKYLYRLKDAHGENRLFVRSDRAEVRVGFYWLPGAFDRSGSVPSNAWKDTPRLRSLSFEYLSPTSVRFSR